MGTSNTGIWVVFHLPFSLTCVATLVIVLSLYRLCFLPVFSPVNGPSDVINSLIRTFCSYCIVFMWMPRESERHMWIQGKVINLLSAVLANYSEVVMNSLPAKHVDNAKVRIFSF